MAKTMLTASFNNLGLAEQAATDLRAVFQAEVEIRNQTSVDSDFTLTAPFVSYPGMTYPTSFFPGVVTQGPVPFMHIDSHYADSQYILEVEINDDQKDAAADFLEKHGATL